MRPSIRKSIRKSLLSRSIGTPMGKLDTFSAETVKAIGKMPNALAAGESEKMNRVIRLMELSGNWDKLDYLMVFAMNDATNGLTSWKGTKTGTNVSGSVHTANQGYLFDGSADYINTNITPSTDLTNGVQDDIHVECYCYDNQDTSALKDIFGSFDSTPNRLHARQNSNLVYRVNSSGS